MPDSTELRGHRGTRAIVRMVEYAPATGGLALWVRHHDLPADDSAALIATDGNSIFYAPGFEGLPVAEQAGLIAHEVLHIALRHPQRYVEMRQLIGDCDRELFNICADAIVNSTLAHLSWLRLPAAAVQLDQILFSALGVSESVEKSLLEWNVERLYRAIDDRRAAAPGAARQARRRQRGDGGENDARPGRGGSEAASDPSHGHGPRADGPRSASVRALGARAIADLLEEAGSQPAPEDEAERAREWGERILRAHAGDGAHSMLRALIADLPGVRTPWEQVLRTRLNRSLSLKAGISWSRPARSYIANQGRAGPHRRMPWEPGRSASRSAPRLVVIVDVSGSIDAALMERFALKIEAITRRLEAGLVLVIGDDRVRRVEHFAPGRADLAAIEFDGAGGTDFTPLLEEADRHRPDIGVVLTDLEGPARFRPRWPVIWAVPEAHAAAEPPFGRKLVLS